MSRNYSVKRNYNDLIGKKYGKLTITGFEKVLKRTYLIFTCDCGNAGKARYESVLVGKTKSCGCYKIDEIKLKAYKHGDCKNRLYSIWKNIKSRVHNKNNTRYNSYGGRGILLCKEWEDYNNFKKWSLENGYSDCLTIDRIDNDGNYEPCNCRWSTNTQQIRNRNVTKFVNYKGEMVCFAELCEKSDNEYYTVLTRIRRGWDIEDAVEMPSFINRKR